MIIHEEHEESTKECGSGFPSKLLRAHSCSLVRPLASPGAHGPHGEAGAGPPRRASWINIPYPGRSGSIFFPRKSHLLFEKVPSNFRRDLRVRQLIGGLQAGYALAQPFAFQKFFELAFGLPRAK